MITISYEMLITVLLSVLGIFTAMMLLTRLVGLRTFAKMSGFDFASTIAIGSILAAVIINKDPSVLKGIVALLGIIGFQTLFSYLVRKSNLFKKLFTNAPKLLMKNGEIYHENLKKCNVGIGDLMAKLREANVHKLSEVQAVVFESTGDISVLHSSDNKEIDSIIIEDVEHEI